MELLNWHTTSGKFAFTAPFTYGDPNFQPHRFPHFLNALLLLADGDI